MIQYVWYYALHAGPTAFCQKIFSQEHWLAEKKRWKPTMKTVDPESVAQYGLAVNQNHGCHQCGTSYSIEKKLEVTEAYRSHKRASDSSWPNITQVALICQVHHNFVDEHRLKLQVAILTIVSSTASVPSFPSTMVMLRKWKGLNYYFLPSPKIHPSIKHLCIQ
jgi:hypothetical protein